MHFPQRSAGPPSSLAQATVVLPGASSEERYLGKSSDLGSEFGEHLSDMSVLGLCGKVLVARGVRD